MSAIGKGDWVQCVDPDYLLPDRSGVVFGGVYCVDDLVPASLPCFTCEAMEGFELVGVPRSPGTCWCAHQFRPLGGNSKARTAPSQRVRENA
jgi:hypothetical protein